MKKLLVLIATFSFAAQASAALKNPFVAATASTAAVVDSVPAKTTFSSVSANVLEKAKSLSKENVAKVESFVTANPKASIAYAVVATLVAERVVSFVYNNLIASNNADEADEDLDIA